MEGQRRGSVEGWLTRSVFVQALWKTTILSTLCMHCVCQYVCACECVCKCVCVRLNLPYKDNAPPRRCRLSNEKPSAKDEIISPKLLVKGVPRSPK